MKNNSGDMENQYQYYAFISYKREDEKQAKWLQRKLESYRLPTVLCKKNPKLPKRVKPIFLDQTDIQPGPLKEELRQKLKQSRFLIVVCSPRSAKSPWVGEEIDYFIYLGRKNNIIAYIVDGEPYSRNIEAECYHEVIRGNFPASDNPKEDRQLLGVNLNEAGKGSKMMKREKAFVKVLSRLLDVSFDELWKRQHRRMIRNLLIYIALIIIFIVTVGFVWKVNQPFDVKVSLKEVTEHNESLPDLDNAIMTVFLENETKTDTLHGMNDVARFTNIPGKSLNKNIQITFSAWGMENLDTIVPLQKNFSLLIRRNKKVYGHVLGFVFDIEKEIPVSNVAVLIQDKEIITDKNGYFSMDIPLKKQQISYSIDAAEIRLMDSIIYMPCDSNVMIRTILK